MYRRGGGRSCAVFGCTNSQRKLSIWRRETCEIHSPLLHNACPCLEPFSFYNFPQDKETRRAWLKAVGRKSDFNPSKASVVCSTHFLGGSPTSEHPMPLLNLKRNAVKGDKTATSDNGDAMPDDGGGDTNTEKGTVPKNKRKRAYKVMLEEETIAGEALEGSSQPEKKKLDIEGRYPQGSWEQATVEAIMNLRTFDTTTTTSQIAQTIIANLKDENDFLRAQNIKLQWELKSVQEKHEAELQATKDELKSLKHRCTCDDKRARTNKDGDASPGVCPLTDSRVVETTETVDAGALPSKLEGCSSTSFGTHPAERPEVGALHIVDHAVQTEIIACASANLEKDERANTDVK